MKPGTPFWRTVVCALACALLASGFAAARAQISDTAPRTWTLADVIHRSEAFAARMQAVPAMRPMANKMLTELHRLAAGQTGRAAAAAAVFAGTTAGLPKGGPHPARSSAAATGYSLTKSGMIPAVTPDLVTAPLAGAPGEYAFTGSGGGSFGVQTRAGKTLWLRDTYSVMTDLGLPQAQRKTFYQAIPLQLTMTYQPSLLGTTWHPLYPMSPTAQGASGLFTTGQLNRNGPGDVVAALHVFTNLAGSPCPWTTAADCKPLLPGTSVIMGTFLVVLDGKTGAMRWSRLFPGYVTQLLVRDHTLLVGNDTGDNATDPDWVGTINGSGEPRTTSAVYAYRFSGGGTRLTAKPAWTFNPGIPWLAWQAFAPAGAGQIAIAYSAVPEGVGQPDGHVRLVSLATGTAHWDVPTRDYPRLVRWDPVSRDVVVMEQADPASDLSYGVAGLRASNGSLAREAWHHGQIPMALAVGDVAGNGHDQWITTQISAANAGLLGTVDEIAGSASVTATDDITGRTAWTTYLPDRVTDDEPLPMQSPRGLALVKVPGGVRVMVGAGVWTLLGMSHPEGDSFDDGSTGALWSLHGGSGAIAWHRVTEGTMNAGQVTQDPGQAGSVLVGGVEPTLTSVDAATGKTRAFMPLLGQMWAVSGYDVNHDGTRDVIAGGNSHTLFAFDGRHLDGNPRVLWHTVLPGSVRQIKLVKLGGKPSLVVAATRAVDVISPATGRVIHQIGYPGDLVAAVTVAPLKRGGPLDLVVPAGTLAAYDGASGHLLWRYRPAANRGHVYFVAAAVSKNGTVDTSYTADAPLLGYWTWANSTVNSTAAGINGSSGKVAWSSQPADYADFNTVMPTGIVTSPAIIGAGGNGVAITWDGPGDSQFVEVRDADTGAPRWHQQVDENFLELFRHTSLHATPAGLVGVVAVLQGMFTHTAIVTITPSGVTTSIDPQSGAPFSDELAKAVGRQLLIKGGLFATAQAGFPGWDYGITAYSLPGDGGTPQQLASTDCFDGAPDLTVLGSAANGDVTLAAVPEDQPMTQVLLPLGDSVGTGGPEVATQIYTLEGPK